MNKIFLFQVIIFSFRLIDSWPNWSGKWLNIFNYYWFWKDSFSKNTREKN